MDESKATDFFTGMRGVDTRDDYYDYSDYYPDDSFVMDKHELCHINKPGNEVAQALTTTLSVFGIIVNCVVLFVMAVLKDYKQSGVFWLIQQFLFTNFILLVAVLLQLINEHHDQWIMGLAMCKLDEATIFIGRSVGIVLLMLANIFSIASLTGLKKKLMILCPSEPGKVFEFVKYGLVLVFVVVPCVIANLPLYKYKNLNNCKRCVLEFPISASELCPMLGLNSTTCKYIMDFIVEGFHNTTDYSEPASYDYDEYSGGFDNKEFDKLLEGNITKMAEMAACKYEEPRSFYAWLLSTFVLFYAVPTFVLIIFAISLFCKTNEKRIDSEVNVRSLHMVFLLDILFLICWSPWNAVHMRKAYGGLGCSGWKCISMILYSRLCALVFNAVSPIIYVCMIGDFKNRMAKAANLTTNFCYHLLKYNESNIEDNSEIGDLTPKLKEKEFLERESDSSYEKKALWDTEQSLPCGTVV